MKNLYQEMKDKHQEMADKLPLHFAFGNDQAKAKIKELGFKDLKELQENVVGIGFGGFCLKKDKKLVDQTFKAMEEEIKQKMDDPKTGDQFLYDAFISELSNHEYCITCDLMPSLMSLNLTLKEVNENERYKKALKKAIAAYTKATRDL